MAEEARSWFYRLQGLTRAKALGPLLERCLSRGWRVLVVGEKASLAELDRDLWTWRDDSFVAHGLASDPCAQEQPVLLSSVVEPLNGAQALVLLDGIDADSTGFERCLIVFDDDAGPIVQAVREQYKRARDNGGARFFSRTQTGWSEQSQSAKEA